MNMRSNYITKLNNLDDWYVVKVSANQSYFEVYMESNNKKMACYIISPTCRSFQLWKVFIANSDEFDGQWSKSPFHLTFNTFNEMKDHINWIDTDKRLVAYENSICCATYKKSCNTYN